MRFRSAPAFDRVPRITLITPQKVRDIGPYAIAVNGRCSTLDRELAASPLFTPQLTISSVSLAQVQPVAGLSTVMVQVAGTGFRASDVLSINGRDISFSRLSSSLALLTTQLIEQPKWTVVVRRADGSESAVLTVENPVVFRQGGGSVTPANQKTQTQRETFVVTLLLEAGHFDPTVDVVQVRGGKVVAGPKFSNNSAVLEVENVTQEFTVIVTRTGTPFAQAWSLQKPKPTK